MSIIKINELQPTTGTTVTITGNTTTTGTSSVSGDVTVTGVISGSSYVGDGSALSGIGIAIQEADGSPAITGVQTIMVTNGTLVDNGGGVVTVDVAGDSGFRPKTNSISPDKMQSGSQVTFTVAGTLYNPATTFSSSNPAIIDVVSQTYVSNVGMTVVLTSSLTLGSASLYAKNASRIDDTPVTVNNISTLNWTPPPLVYFDFEEGTGTTVNNKSNTTYVYPSVTPNYTASEFTGTLRTMGTALPQWFTGSSVRGTYSMHWLDASAGYIDMGMWDVHMWQDFIQSSGSFSITFWARGNSGDPYSLARGVVYSNRTSRYYGGFGVGLWDVSEGADFSGMCKKESNWSSYNTINTDNTGVNTDTWYHYVWTVTSGTVGGTHLETLYIDTAKTGPNSVSKGGQVYWHSSTKGTDEAHSRRKIGLVANSGYDDNYGIRGGLGGPGTAHRFSGCLDEFAMYDYVLTDKQVAWIYNSGSGRDLADGVPPDDLL